MGFGKFLACVVGGAVAVIAAPVLLPAAAIAGAAVASGVAAAGATAAGVAAGAAAAIGSTTVGGAVVGAASAAVGAVGTAAAAVGSTAIGSAVAGAVSTAAGSIGTAVAGTVTATVAVAGEAGVAAAIGAAVTYTATTAGEGFKNMSDAKEIIAAARKRYRKKRDELDVTLNASNNRLFQLNEFKMSIYANEVKKSINLLSKIVVTKEKEIVFKDKDQVVYLFKGNELTSMKQTAIQATQIMNEVTKGAGFLKAAATGSLGFMSQFGIASTGTAISSLSGVAATNATLAALGGGALSAGGGGMALGSSVLGGITILPAAMMMSWSFAKQSEKALTEATEYHASLEKEIANMDLVSSFVKQGINPRMDEIYAAIDSLVKIYNSRVLPDFKNVMKRNVDDTTGKVLYDQCSEPDKQKIKLATFFLRKIKELLAVKVLSSNGKLDATTKVVINSVKNNSMVKGILSVDKDNKTQ